MLLFTSGLFVPVVSKWQRFGWLSVLSLRFFRFHSKRHCHLVSAMAAAILATGFMDNRYVLLLMFAGSSDHVFGKKVVLNKEKTRDRSGRCQNKNCVKPATNARRQSRGGLGGYCATCAHIFVPELYAKYKIPLQICPVCTHTFVRLHDGTCRLCKTLPGAGKACAYCQSPLEGDTGLQQCNHTSGCVTVSYTHLTLPTILLV